MISICIPAYNTDCTDLLKSLRNQIDKTDVQIEVLLANDGSSLFDDVNRNECKRHGFTYLHSDLNEGRVKTRMRLAIESKHDWILFLDADMLPAADDFINKYCKSITKDKYEVYVGGHCYKKNNSLFSLRQNYGNAREDIAQGLRNKRPYNHIFFGNIAIKKRLFITIFSTYFDSSYGEDIYLSGILRKQKVAVLHLKNKTFHLGIESNAAFVSKTEAAASTVARLYSEKKIDKSQSKLISYYDFLTRYKLTSLTHIGLVLIRPILKRSLLWFGNPLLFIDLFRLYHFLKKMRNGH
ncbi:MAG: glycosyltransferase [Flavobacteriaceae bacterium]|nr:glycosyltransferase [Flavobacteriaceae bacterium]MDG2289763.1 glycosyltransferase [Flavobacteriaceae bacterium]